MTAGTSTRKTLWTKAFDKTGRAAKAIYKIVSAVTVVWRLVEFIGEWVPM
ncbi:hypothetical protein [Arthrobacter sp. zg-Y895]|nr:hypothetical protein [Arthrobacter sp. zg-Y895]MCC3302777.1 hypothetical protein [Arthrobacter sp. zg-Y895]